MAAPTPITFCKVFLFCCFILIGLQLRLVRTDSEEADSKAVNSESGDRWKKKDIRDYSDADVERLYEQWEVRYIVCLNIVSPVFDESLRCGRLRIAEI